MRTRRSACLGDIHLKRSLTDWLHWQESLHPRAIEMGLGRVGEVAHRLGLPDRHIRTLSVAGTNGKGSSATLAAGIYQAAGYRVGLYTSPHLLHYNERIAIDSAPMRDEDICRAFSAIEVARQEISLTYFEYGTLAALWLFREAQVDVQVLEVGLGGRLDAVNLVDADTTLITNIGLDHLDWLGPDRETIAVEKAGIMRSGRPAIYVDPEPVQVIADIAQEKAVPLRVLHQDFDYRIGNNGWDWLGHGESFAHLPMPGLGGEAQLRNAAGVIAAIRALDGVLPVSESSIRVALPKLQLAGRFQRIGPVILDVAHNAEAAGVLADNLAQENIKGRVFLILAMLADKPVEEFASVLAPHACEILVASLPGPRGLSGEVLSRRLKQVGIKALIHTDVPSALSAARQQMQEDDVIVVTGSFLTVAAAADVLI